MKSVVTFTLLSLIFTQKGYTESPPQQLTGQWYTEGKQAIFEFYKEKQEYRARLQPLLKPNMIDSHNPVDSLKNRKIAGVTTIWGLRYNPQKKRFEGGRVYNPENGKIYFCHCKFSEDGKKLLFRGYLAISALGQTQVWTRKE